MTAPDPIALALLAGAALLYRRAIRTLAGRGRRISAWQQAAWYSGLGVMVLALMGPTGAYDDRLLLAHMGEHVMLADLAAPLLLAGLRTPVLQFVLPRSVLVPLARRRGLRRAFGMIRRPLLAIPIYLVVLYGWHFRAMFEGAVRHDWMHALQHESFILISLLVWWSALEPQKARLPGNLWKIGHIFAARLVSIFLGMALIFMGHPAYSGVYNDTERYGLSPLADQQSAGGLMMTMDILIIAFALTLFFWRAAGDYDREQARHPAPSA